MPAGLAISTQPTHEPVTLDEAKRFIRQDEDYDDDYVRMLITAARNRVESDSARALVNRTYQYKLDDLSGEIELPYPPLVSITSVTYVNQSDATITVASSVYEAITDTTPGRVIEADGQSWPTGLRGHTEDVIVTYIAGYGTSDDVPEEFRVAVLMYIAQGYEQRMPVVVGSPVNEMRGGMAADALVGMNSAKGFV